MSASLLNHVFGIRGSRPQKAEIEAVATDMSRAGIAAVLENLPETALVFDRFHIMKLDNEKLTNLWRQRYREAVEGLDRDVRGGVRWTSAR